RLKNLSDGLSAMGGYFQTVCPNHHKCRLKARFLLSDGLFSELFQRRRGKQKAV
ncbi:hypothetical protein HMPREF9120_00963, partial [Neisseria sp. oral taxon 020 str. F0370]